MLEAPGRVGKNQHKAFGEVACISVELGYVLALGGKLRELLIL